MRRYIVIALLAGATMLSTNANAALLGLQVNGSLKFGANPSNFYDPANGGVPGGFGNSTGQPVTIGAITEFGYQDAANRDTADFTDTQLIIRDQVLSFNAAPWEQTFTLVGGPVFSSLALVSDTFAPGLTFGLNAGTITINWAGILTAPHDFRAVFDVGVAAIPEPATWAMMIAGFGLAGAAMRRRTRITVAYTA